LAISYKTQFLSVYPQDTSVNLDGALYLVFPDGAKITTEEKREEFFSTYFIKGEHTTESYIVTIMKYSEKIDTDVSYYINESLFANYSSLYIDRVAGFISEGNEVDVQKQLLVAIKNKGNQEANIKEIVDHFTVCDNCESQYNRNEEKPISIKKYEGIPYLSEESITTLFKCLSVQNIIKIFESLLLERGVYFIGSRRDVAFSIVDSLISFIYPLVYEYPKVISLESNHGYFESPIPMIYFIISNDFKEEKLSNGVLNGKILVHLDIDVVVEYGDDSYNLPSKIEKNLKKRLETCIAHDAKLDYWAVRDSFFETVQEFIQSYPSLLEIKSVEQLGIISSEKLTKEFNKDKKNREFMLAFTRTMMFNQFIESRLLPETIELDIQFRLIDKLLLSKRSKSNGYNLLRSYVDSIHLEQLYVGQNTAPKSYLYKWNIFEYFLGDRDLEKIKTKKWGHILIEASYTIWLIMLEIYLRRSKEEKSIMLYSYAYEYFMDHYNTMFEVNFQMLLSLVYMAGRFKKPHDLVFIANKFKKLIADRNLLPTLICRYKQGEASVCIYEMEESDLDGIPNSIKSHFEINEFCMTCGMFIPEEFVFAQFQSDWKSPSIFCPNKACQKQYFPKFSITTLRWNDQPFQPNSANLYNPLKLLITLEECLNRETDEFIIFDQEKMFDVYWNNLFYSSLLNLPSFFAQKRISSLAFDICIGTLGEYYITFEKKTKHSGKGRHTGSFFKDGGSIESTGTSSYDGSQPIFSEKIDL